jgi:hypothetical protein
MTTASHESVRLSSTIEPRVHRCSKRFWPRSTAMAPATHRRTTSRSSQRACCDCPLKKRVIGRLRTVAVDCQGDSRVRSPNARSRGLQCEAASSPRHGLHFFRQGTSSVNKPGRWEPKPGRFAIGACPVPRETDTTRAHHSHTFKPYGPQCFVIHNCRVPQSLVRQDCSRSWRPSLVFASAIPAARPVFLAPWRMKPSPSADLHRGRTCARSNNPHR